MESEKATTQIHDFVVSNFLFDSGNIADDASLMGEGVIDSTGILELVMFVEETFAIIVTDEEVIPENFDSISALARYVTGKLQDTPGIDRKLIKSGVPNSSYRSRWWY